MVDTSMARPRNRTFVDGVTQRHVDELTAPTFRTVVNPASSVRLA